MKQAFFWGSWFTTLGTTALLLLWSLPLSPFTHPGTTANEAAIIFFPVMGLRWLAIASAVTLVIIFWGQRLNLATSSVIGLIVLALALHLIFGLINLGIMNVWLSVEPIKTRTNNAVYAGIYFGLPIFWILLTAYLMLRLTHFRN